MSRVSITELLGSSLSVLVHPDGKMRRYFEVAPSTTASFEVDPSEEVEVKAVLQAEAERGVLSYNFGPSDGAPVVQWIDGTIAAAGGDGVLKGRNLLQGQAFDTLEHGLTTSKLTITAMKPGESGYSVRVINGGAVDVSVSGKVITIQAILGTSTANAIATAFNIIGGLIGKVRCVSGGAGTAVAALAQTPLAGGVGSWENNTVKVAGFDCLPKHATGTAPAATWSAAEITVTVPALTGAVATDTVAVELESNGNQAPVLSAVLV